jgi:hypothetical protein
VTGLDFHLRLSSKDCASFLPYLRGGADFGDISGFTAFIDGLGQSLDFFRTFLKLQHNGFAMLV